MRDFQTIGERFDYVKGRPAGFDYMKITLAMMVVVFHSVSVSHGSKAGEWLWDTPAQPFFRAVLPLFFGVSGFLVSASLDRCNTLIKFLGLRAIRIYPALAVEVTLSAFIIGPLLTTYTLQAYFSDPLFASYLLNAVGEIHYRLPGLFADNPHPHTVNGQLWTIPYELYSYIAVAGIAVLGVKRKRIIAPITVVVLTLLHFVMRLKAHEWQYVPFEGALSGSLLVLSAMVGVTLYFYRDVIPWTPAAFAAATLATLIGLSFPWGGEYASLFTPYVAIYLGLMDPKRIFLVKNVDYSYGMYLYGFVIQQTFAALVPEGRHWLINSVVCVFASFAFAAFSWHVVEKPAQKAKVLVDRLEALYLAVATKWRSRAPAVQPPQ